MKTSTRKQHTKKNLLPLKTASENGSLLLFRLVKISSRHSPAAPLVCSNEHHAEGRRYRDHAASLEEHDAPGERCDVSRRRREVRLAIIAIAAHGRRGLLRREVRALRLMHRWTSLRVRQWVRHVRGMRDNAVRVLCASHVLEGPVLDQFQTGHDCGGRGWGTSNSGVLPRRTRGESVLRVQEGILG